MKFLLDENMPPSLSRLLQNAGYEARHVNEIGYNNTPDFKISEFAAISGEIIITHDTDFGTILALTGSERPSVVLFRWKTISAQSVF
jgi:predicted nuclease of predicted toxin-antitoxin system